MHNTRTNAEKDIAYYVYCQQIPTFHSTLRSVFKKAPTDSTSRFQSAKIASKKLYHLCESPVELTHRGDLIFIESQSSTSNSETLIRHVDAVLHNPSTISRPGSYGPPEIHPSEISYDPERDFLGAGSFGKVFKGRCRSCQVAVKVPKNQNLSEKELENIRHEVLMMRRRLLLLSSISLSRVYRLPSSQIFHPNVVLFMGACTLPGQLFIVTECLQTDLEKLLRSPRGRSLPLVVRMKMARDAARGMSWLHGITHIVHRDLKPANLLVDQNYLVKVTDFGFSSTLRAGGQRDIKGPKGSAIWMSPEVMQGLTFDEKIDIYAFAIILWELYTLKEPFSEYQDWVEFTTAVCARGARPAIPNECPYVLKRLMEESWDARPTARPSFPAIIYRIDIALVAISIDYMPSAQFWVRHFVAPKHELEEIVQWDDFMSKVCLESGLSPSRYEIIRSLLEGVYGADKRVTLHSFNRCINWFGNFHSRDTADESLSQAEQVINAMWFHGPIEKLEAEGRLLNRPPGTFLVRLSKTVRESPFTLSLTGGRHYRIHQDLDGGADRRFFVELRTAGKDERTAVELAVAFTMAGVDALAETGATVDHKEPFGVSETVSRPPANDDGAQKSLGKQRFYFSTIPMLVEGVRSRLGLAEACPRQSTAAGYYS